MTKAESRFKMPYRAKANSWQPARLRWVDHAILMVGLIIIAFTRGLDYLIGDDRWGARDFMIAAAPEWVWGGIGFIAGAVILSFGVTTRRHLFVYIGHGWLFSAYALNALALILASGPDLVVPITFGVVLFLLAMTFLIHWLSKSYGRVAFLVVLVVAGLHAGGLYYSNSFDGVRGGGAVGLVAIIHFIYALRTGGRPLRVGESTITEKVVEGGPK